MKILIASIFSLSLLGATAASADVGVGAHVGDVGAGVHVGTDDEHHDRDHRDDRGYQHRHRHCVSWGYHYSDHHRVRYCRHWHY